MGSFSPTASNLFLFTVLGSKWGLLWIWLILINVIALVVFGVDKALSKAKAKHPQVRRVPEKTLFLLAAIGGGLGAWLGMQLFRHKTQHRSFRFGIPAILIAWIVILSGLYVYFNFIR